MRFSRNLFVLALAAMGSAPAHALECVNGGALAQGEAPNDADNSTATACGPIALAAADFSTAIGFAAESHGNHATALGYLALASGVRTTAIGFNAVAEGYLATAAGAHARAAGLSSTALGQSAAAQGDWSAAMGYNAVAEGHGSLAVGRLSNAQGEASTAIGYRAMTEGARSTALGFNASAPEADTVIIGAIAGVNLADISQSVGIGTIAPLAPLHVARDDGTAGILVQENALDPAGRTLFTLANRGNTKFEIKETVSGTRWQFTNSGDAFRVSKFGTGQVEFQVKNNGDAWVLGDMIVGGTLLELSDRNQKHTIVRLDGVSVLDKLAQVPVSEWSYKGESADQRHIGPMAQDFHAAFGLASGETRISARDMAGVNMAAVKALAAENRALKSANSELEGRISRLEALLVPWDGELALR